MNLEQLRSFVEVARLGHFTHAAEQLHLAQPSLSRQISTLESGLGAELFHRVRGNITLTDAGEHLLPIARRMLADADTARSEIAELAGLGRGRIRLGATPSLCTSLVVDVVSEFRERYPGIDIEILERGSRSLTTALLEGGLDLALIVTNDLVRNEREVIKREVLLSEQLVAISAAAAPDPFMNTEPSTRLIRLAEIPQIAFPENYDLRAAMDASFSTAGLIPKIVVEGAEMDSVLRFVERGVGVAVVPAMVVAGRSGLRVTPMFDAGLIRTISIAHRSDTTPTHAATAMRAVVHQIADLLASQDEALVSRI